MMIHHLKTSLVATACTVFCAAVPLFANLTLTPPDGVILSDEEYASWYDENRPLATWHDYWVDNTWTGTPSGTEHAPFTNIQSTINFVHTNDGTWSAVTIYIKDGGTPYLGQINIPNLQALRLFGTNGTPSIIYEGTDAVNTIQSGTNYFGAGMPPAQVGLVNLHIENRSTASDELYCAAIHTWHSQEPGKTTNRFGVHRCRFDGRGDKGGVFLYDLKQHGPYEPYNSNLVWNSHFYNCTVGIDLISQAEAHIFGNYFISNDIAIRATATTNMVYQRRYTDIIVYHNVFAWNRYGGVDTGIYPKSQYFNNTFYANGGTNFSFAAAALEPEGTNIFHNNIFYGGQVAWISEPVTTNRLDVAHNLYFNMAYSNDWEAFGTDISLQDPVFYSEDATDALFLYLADNSPAAHLGTLFGGATYLGALPPVPEPIAGIALLIAVTAIWHRRKI